MAPYFRNNKKISANKHSKTGPDSTKKVLNLESKKFTFIKLDLLTITTHSTEIFYRLRWGDCIACPECGSVHIYNPEAGKQHICADCDHRFSDTSGTAFHSTKLPLAKWLVAIYMFCTQSKGISSYNLARMIAVSQPTAWRMLMVLRCNIQHDLKSTDTAIIDEVYLGADWKKKPYRDKIQKCSPPNPVWNLKGKDLKRYYSSQITTHQPLRRLNHR